MRTRGGVMGMHGRRVATATGLLLAVGTLTAPVPATAVTLPAGATAAAVTAGTGSAAPARSVTVGAANARARAQARVAVPPAPLGRDGRPAGSALGTGTGSGASRRARPGPAARPGGPNRPGARGAAAAARPGARSAPGPAPSAAPAAAGFAGITEGGSDCTNCQTPDATAAVSGTEIAETANLRMQVYSKSGGTLCTMSLSGLFGAVTGLSRPRIQYDNASNRFSVVADSVPGSAFDVPIQYLAASQTADACGAWWVYSIIFNGSTPNLYPLGALLDYPYLGQDGTSLLSSTNNYSPAGAITLQAVIRSAFSAPSRRVLQPGTAQTLDPLDGRIESAAVQDGSFVRFAHGVNFQGFPTVRYGAINVTNGQPTTAVAYHSPSSDDFNPSIAVSDAGGNTNFIWVNWAYTNAQNGVPVSDTVAGVAPGEGVPVLAGADLTLVRGSSTSAIATFGGYSSAAIDPAATGSCPAGETALTAQEYFTASGSWTTRLA